MKLSLSCRIAEGFLSKEEAKMSLSELSDLAVGAGYEAICMRASQIGVHTPRHEVAQAKRTIQERGLRVSMITGDFDIVYNNERGPRCLRGIGPYLDLAQELEAPLIRVCVKTEEDIAAASRAADEAAERGLALAHQCHVQSLFETVDDIERRLRQINRPNFGLIFEAANLEECGQDYGPAAIARLVPWIRNVYLQNQRLNPKGAITLNTWTRGPISFDVIDLPEAGGIDFACVFEGLKRSGYDGVVTVHQSAPEDGASPASAAAKTAAFIRSFA